MSLSKDQFCFEEMEASDLIRRQAQDDRRRGTVRFSSGSFRLANGPTAEYRAQLMDGIPPRVNVLGVGVHALNLPSAVAAIGRAIETRTKGYICVTGVHGVSEAQEDVQFRAILNHAFLNTPDGMPMVWVGRSQGFSEMQRVYGPDLVIEVCQASLAAGWRHFFYGGGPGTADALAHTLRGRFPGLQVVGTHTPPFRPLNEAEMKELQGQIAAAQPDIIWVGLSTPKQERFMAANLAALDVPLMIGIGAAFDLISGGVRQSPRWIQRSGFEWLYRLIQEPRRLWKRYLKNNPLFVYRIFLQFTGLRTYSIASSETRDLGRSQRRS